MHLHLIRYVSFCMFVAVSTELLASVMQRDTIRTDIDLVVVPVSVRDQTGKFVYDVQREDFSLLEDGKPQVITQFSTEPVPLSIAVLLDTGLGGNASRRIASSIVSLSSAFTDMDEVELYRFDSSVTKMSDFTSSREVVERNLVTLQKLAEGKREGDLMPVVAFAGRGPKWLRWLLDATVPTRVLNEALFAAAADLGKRKPEMRRVVILISDGQVAHSAFSFEQIRSRLLQSQIQVYAVAIGISVVTGRTSILNAYADATGGDVHPGRTQKAMEDAFSRITEQARHQYVLAYISTNEVSGQLPITRTIEVKTMRSDLTITHRRNYLQYPRRREPGR